MKLTNQEIINHLNSIPALAGVEFPVKITYALKKNHRKLVTEYKDYEAQLDDLREKYPKLDEDEDFNKAVKELLAIENEIDIFMLDESIFETGDFNVTATQLEILEFMIESK